MAEANEQSFKVVLAGFLDFAALHPDVIDRELLTPAQLGQIIAKRCDVLGEILLGFFECDEYPGLVVIERAVHQEFDGEKRLAATGAAADKGRPAAGQPAEGD